MTNGISSEEHLVRIYWQNKMKDAILSSKIKEANDARLAFDKFNAACSTRSEMIEEVKNLTSSEG